MYARWTSHLKDENNIREFKRLIYSSKEVLDRLKDIIEEDEASLTRSEMNPKTYENGSWSHLQAHKNGIRQYLCQIKTLIDLDQQEGTIHDR